MKIILIILILVSSLYAYTSFGRFNVSELYISTDITGYIIKDNDTKYEWLYIPGCQPVRIDNK